MTKYFCDKCGKDLDCNYYYEIRMEDKDSFGVVRNFDLCYHCGKALTEWILPKEKKDEND